MQVLPFTEMAMQLSTHLLTEMALQVSTPYFCSLTWLCRYVPTLLTGMAMQVLPPPPNPVHCLSAVSKILGASLVDPHYIDEKQTLGEAISPGLHAHQRQAYQQTIGGFSGFSVVRIFLFSYTLPLALFE